MSTCPKNIIEKKFLWWKYKVKGPHEIEGLKVKLLTGWTVKVDRKCKHCGRTVFDLAL